MNIAILTLSSRDSRAGRMAVAAGRGGESTGRADTAGRSTWLLAARSMLEKGWAAAVSSPPSPPRRSPPSSSGLAVV